MFIYAGLLLAKEASQMCLYGRNYLEDSGNNVDLLAITSVLVITSSLSVYEVKEVPWILNLIQIVILITWFRLFNDFLDCLPSTNVDQVMGMFSHVCKSYLKILLCFAPFFVAFATFFKGKKNN